MEKDVYILAVESSCDETAAAVVKNGREVLSNVIYTQIALHTEYGGEVPEIASRKHIEKINQVIEQALSDSGKKLNEMTAIAVTYGPGLVGALLVGVSAAKAISFATGIPLVGVHHIEGHISANYIENKDLEPPFICLVVSGGHSHLVVVKDYGEYEISEERGVVRQERHLTRWRVPLDWAIREVRRLTRWQKKEIPMPFIFREPRSGMPFMISASVV